MVRLSKERPRVVIVDDSRTVQALLEHLLTNRLGYDIVGIASDGEAARPMIERLRPDLVTIDLLLPYVGGEQLLRHLRGMPEVRKVVISGSAGSNLAMKASLEALGADACIGKSDLSRNPDGFCKTLAAVMASSKRNKPAAAPATPSHVPVAGYPVPLDERERLAALQRLGLCNTDAERTLDLLTEHMARTTSFAACIMTFIDEGTQWVKSGHGFDRGSMPRAQAICNHTICGDEPFIISDTKTDGRFNKLPVVLSGAIRAYVGYPIVASSGVRLGAICLLDSKPRRVTVTELSSLRSIARIATALIESRAPSARQAA